MIELNQARLETGLARSRTSGKEVDFSGILGEGDLVEMTSQTGNIIESLAAHSPLTFIHLAADGQILKADGDAFNKPGGDDRPWIGSNLGDLIEIGSRRELKDFLASSKAGSAEPVELRIADGTKLGRPVRLIGIPLENNGAPPRIMGALVDLFDLERLEKKLDEVNNRLRTVYKCIPVSTITWQWQENDFQLIDFNDVAEEITTGKIREHIGSTAAEFYAKRPDIIADLNLCLTKRRYIKRQWPYTFQTTGSEVYFIATFAYIAPDMVMVHTQDITKRRQAEENLHTYQQQILSMALELSKAEERERRRIAADLHDGVGQYLALSRLKLSKMKKTATPEQQKVVDEVIELIRRATEDTRSLTVELSPPVLYELGLQAALGWLAENTLRRHGISTSFNETGQQVHLSEELRGFLYRSAAELISNVAKHSKAAKAEICLIWWQEALRLSVTDNGQGFEYQEHGTTVPKGFGLFSIRERLRPLGGRIKVISEKGLGAQVSLTLPLTDDFPKQER